MLKGDLPWVLALCAAMICGATELSAGDARELPRAESVIVISQRVIETGREGESDATTVEVFISNRSTHIAEDVTVCGTAPNSYRLRAASLLPTRDRERLTWAIGNLQANESRTLRLQWEPQPNLPEIPLKCVLRAYSRFGAESVLDAPARQLAAKISLAVPDFATVGVPVAVRIQIANPNNRPIRDVSLLASFGEGMSHALGKELENPLGTIESGQVRTIPLELIPTKAGDLRGKVRVLAASGAVSEAEFILRTVETSLALSISAPALVNCRAAAFLSFMVRNNGSEPQRRVRLVVQLPNGISYSAANNGGGYVESGRCVYWNLGDLKPSEQRVLKLDTLAQIAGEQKITAILSADAREPHTHSILLQVQNPALHGTDQGRWP